MPRITLQLFLHLSGLSYTVDFRTACTIMKTPVKIKCFSRPARGKGPISQDQVQLCHQGHALWLGNEYE